MVHIYFDTFTFDRVEKDIKVTLSMDSYHLNFAFKGNLGFFKGNLGGPAGSDRRNNGPLYWILYSQRH